MPLLSVRDEFIRKSGRYELGTITAGSTAGTDDGADWYINAGQRFLDRRIPLDALRARRLFTLEVDEYLKIFRQAKTIENVWIIESDGSLTELDRMPLATIRNYYGETVSVMDSGTPMYWSPASVRLDPDSRINEVEHTIDSMTDFVLGVDNVANGIVVSPPTDTEVTLDILGRFFSPELLKNGDSSIWTESYPDLLVMASLYKLEVFHRNTEGAKDWLLAMDLDLSEIDMSDVMFNAEHINQMKG